MFFRRKHVSPVRQQGFIWVADYIDGSYLSEYAMGSKLPKDFYSIKKDMLKRFGLVGHDMALFFYNVGGKFYIDGRLVEVEYKLKDGTVYELMQDGKFYNDIITYKDATSSASPVGNSMMMRNTIDQYNFGYKGMNEYRDGVLIGFKYLCHLPVGGRAFMSFRLVSNKDLDGVLVIKSNGQVKEEVEAPLIKNVGGELKWLIR